ncbi:hypothetical protein ACOMHN_020075 [Nucella lapillus]
MEWTVLSCLLLTSCVSAQAEPVASSRQENRSQYPDPAALLSSGQPQRVGALLLLKDYMTQGDTLLKDRLKESYSNLKEQLQEGDSALKEQIMEGVAQVKEQRKEGDERLKEELNEDVAWLKDKLAKGQTRLKEELAEHEANAKRDLATLRDAFNKLIDSNEQQSRPSSAVLDELRRQMSGIQEELKSTKLQLHNTQTELKTNQDTLQSTQESLQSTQTDLQTLQVKVQGLEFSHQHYGLLQSSQMEDRNFTAIGSTFTRWGRTSCPVNTSLVYSGVVGGTHYDHTGGASNYLCLVMDPQLDNMTLPTYYNYLFGSEYEKIQGHQDQDVVCSVCRAPQATTLMIPATLTCPAGWTNQYSGHLVSGHYKHKGRTEYVCLDEIREHREGGLLNQNGALFYHVVTQCGSLPCPPYVNIKVVTCVVCSM